MTEIIEAILFLIPGFLFFEIFCMFSGKNDKDLSEKQYYLICLSISFFIQCMYALYLRIDSFQELMSQVIQIKFILPLYLLIILVAFFISIIVKKFYFKDHTVINSEPWQALIKGQTEKGAAHVTLFTSDGSEFEGKILMFAHRVHERREMVLEKPELICRNDDKTVKDRIEFGSEILFTQDDIRRIVFYKSSRNNEKLDEVKIPDIVNEEDLDYNNNSNGEPWQALLKSQTEKGTAYVTLFTSDGSEFEGKILMFAQRADERREIVLEEPELICRNDDKTVKDRIEFGSEILFTQADIRRIVFYKSSRYNVELADVKMTDIVNKEDLDNSNSNVE